MQTKVQARSIIQQYLPEGDILLKKLLGNNEADEIESILDIIGEEKITGFQLMDILEQNKELAAAKLKLAAKVQ